MLQILAIKYFLLLEKAVFYKLKNKIKTILLVLYLNYLLS